MDTGFRILVVVPTLGRRLDTLERTLASISAQQGVGVDIVVVAPVANEPLRAAADLRGARLVLEGGHISAAVNRGFALAGPAHRYVAWIGDDDYLHPGALARSAATLESRPGSVAAFGNCDYVDLSGQLLFNRRPPPGAAWWLQFVPGLIKQETCLFRKDAVAAVGGLDVSLRYAMDLDLLLRLRRIGTLARVDMTLAAFCWHPGSITIANREVSFAEAQAVQRRSANGIVRVLNPLAQPLFRHLLLAMSKRINTRYLRGA
ncbi:MAG: glycosyltransferase [Burkholderiaceae bacterium]|nr:glycosyltransferase [Burkholderiaceae bacterium]